MMNSDFKELLAVLGQVGFRSGLGIWSWVVTPLFIIRNHDIQKTWIFGWRHPQRMPRRSCKHSACLAFQLLG